MQGRNKSSFSERSIGNIAWLILLVTTVTIGHVLKLFYRLLPPRQEVDDSAPIRVGFCENGAGYGGAVISLVAFLEKIPAGFTPVIYTSIDTPRYAALGARWSWRHMPPISLFNMTTLKRIRFPMASTLDNLLNLLPYALSYYMVFRRDRIECVYLNNDASCNLGAALAAKMARLPVVLHSRGFNRDTKGNRWVLANLDHCIAVSTAVRNELLHLGMDPEKCTVVHEGLDLQLFHPKQPVDAVRRELRLGDGEPVVTLVGGLVEWKGQDVLLAAAPLILEKFPDAHILLVGGGYGKDNKFADRIAKQAASPALRSRVRLLGTRDDVEDILSCSDIVVHASTEPEPFGRTFLEGMALGKAVIASNEGGPLDVISHEVDGLLIHPREPVTLANAIIRLLADREFAAALGRRAAVTATAYAIENHVTAIVTALNAMPLRKQSYADRHPPLHAAAADARRSP